MKEQYLGDSKDSFKWDYHDYLTRKLGYSQLNIVLMMTDGNKKPEGYPAKEEVLNLCHELKKNPYRELLRSLPEKTGAAYSVELHNGDRIFTATSRRDYFEGFSDSKDQVVFVDPDTGFEPEKSCSEAHVKFSEIKRIIEQVTRDSVVSVYQDLIRKNPDEYYNSVREQVCGFTTSIYWGGKAMFVLLSQSENRIRQVCGINVAYRKCVLSRRPDFKDKLSTVP